MVVVNRVKKTSISKLLRQARDFYKKEARGNLPWRNLPLNKEGACDPYKILVSEVMLQQTQVARVVPFYERFIKKFPTARALSDAPLSQVLAAWQGLGYNRRAKYLREAAKIISSAKILSKKSSQEFFASLPGVGAYTAGAIASFAYNEPAIFIETNIRTVFLHHCFHSSILQKTAISDAELLPLVAEALKKSKMEPREFYWMLMDYGAHLKRQGSKLNTRSKHYVKQSKFEGSARQLRGAILRELLKGPKTEGVLIKNLSPHTREEIKRELTRLQREGMVVRGAGRYSIG